MSCRILLSLADLVSTDYCDGHLLYTFLKLVQRGKSKGDTRLVPPRDLGTQFEALNFKGILFGAEGRTSMDTGCWHCNYIGSGPTGCHKKRY
jgi:hypothetical protein